MFLFLFFLNQIFDELFKLNRFSSARGSTLIPLCDDSWTHYYVFAIIIIIITSIWAKLLRYVFLWAVTVMRLCVFVCFCRLSKEFNNKKCCLIIFCMLVGSQLQSRCLPTISSTPYRIFFTSHFISFQFFFFFLVIGELTNYSRIYGPSTTFCWTDWQQ